MTQTVDWLLLGGTVVTMNKDYDVITNGGIAVLDDSIVAVDTAVSIQQNYIAKNSADFSGKVIIPGLVNSHTHLPMTLLRGLNDDLRLDVWLGLSHAA